MMTASQSNQPAKGRELISFSIGGQQFCVDIMAVREIRGWSQATPLPHAPDYVQGMINLRGTVLPIIDMNGRLGIAASDAAGRRVIIVVWIGARLVGLLVDSVCDILTVSEDMIQPPPDVASDSLRGFVSGVLTIEERMVCMIALEHLLPELGAAAA
jgi:purine-binding chemotaxis protein CheW